MTTQEDAKQRILTAIIRRGVPEHYAHKNPQWIVKTDGTIEGTCVYDFFEYTAQWSFTNG